MLLDVHSAAKWLNGGAFVLPFHEKRTYTYVIQFWSTDDLQNQKVRRTVLIILDASVVLGVSRQVKPAVP